ncbi:MAG: NGG1p interacting factor NIF3 [Methanomassiliicoccus sp.]|nr:NGG1p interacting factor NIF3 [Methanomassiliicoccus sp.]
MRLSDYYRLAVEEAKNVDPRRGAELESALQRTRREYDGLDATGKERFDADSLWNPYADSRILYDDGREDIASVMWGIDITPAEVLLADRLREKGRSIDAVIGHHPRGRAQASLYKVMPIQETMMCSWGVPVTAAECILAPRMHDVMCATHSINHAQTVDACRLLDIPFMCLHQPCDLLGQDFMQKLLDRGAPDRLGDLLELLGKIPEYDRAIRECNPPEIYAGGRDRRAGRIAVKFAGGTAAPKEMYEQLSRSGIGTVVCMHAPESHIEEARKHHVNIVVAGHMASDSLGVNLLADRFEERGLNIIPCSGFTRVRRN